MYKVIRNIVCTSVEISNVLADSQEKALSLVEGTLSTDTYCYPGSSGGQNRISGQTMETRSIKNSYSVEEVGATSVIEATA